MADIKEKQEEESKNQNQEDSQNNKNQNKNGNKNNKSGNKNHKNNKGGNNMPRKNDYSFYAADDQIARDVASIPFNYISGSEYQFKRLGGYVTKDTPLGKVTLFDTKKFGKSITNFGVIRYIPSIGVTNARNEGVNMSSLQLYAYIRRANSGARNYEAPDLMMYGLAFKDLIKEFCECRRIIGLTNKSHYFNHSFPDLVLYSLGIDAQDLRSNWAQYRAQLNIIGKKINSFAFPNVFKAYTRSVFISSFLFSDSTSPRAQFYAYASDGYYKWSGTTSTTGTELIYTRHHIPTAAQPTITFAERLQILEEQLNAMFLDEDALTMSGDILKAFPESQLLQVMSVDENTNTESMFDENVLAQIENMITLSLDGEAFSSDQNINTPEFNKSFNITQENQIIKFNPYWNIQMKPTSGTVYQSANTDAILNSHKDQPDYKDVLEWTRLSTTYDIYIESITKADTNIETVARKVTSSGLEIPLYMTMFNYKYDESGSATPDSHCFVQYLADGLTGNRLVNHLADIQCDWHPVVYAETNSSGGLGLGFDSKVTTVIAFDTLKAINNAAIYGAFYTGSLFTGRK